MPEPDLISVIIPVFNTGDLLPRCLESILSQTWDHLEILIVNDGSTDDSASILQSFQESDPRILVITQPNQGLSAARNAALDRAGGKWIMFLDSDDYVSPDFCESAVRCAEEHQADLVLFDAVGVMDGTGYTWPESNAVSEGLYDKKTILRALAGFSILPNAWNKLYRKELFDEIRFPEGECWEDCAVMHCIIDRAERVYVLRRPLYYYVHRQNSITKTAQRDLSIYAWRYKQYGQRYRYMLENYPDIAKAMAASQEETALKYCAAAALSSGSPETFRDIRAQILGEKAASVPIPRAADASFRIRFARILLRLSPILFRTASRYILAQKRN